MKGLAECDRKSTGELLASAFSLPSAPKWRFVLPALSKCISRDHEGSPAALRPTRDIPEYRAVNRQLPVAEAKAGPGGLLFETGLIPEADLFKFFHFFVFSLEPSSKREAARGGGRGKKRGRWTCYFPW